MGKNSGILTSAIPLSDNHVKALEKLALETGETFVYLNKDSELCFAGKIAPDVFKDLAWSNAYELATGPDGFTRSEYKKDSLETFFLDKISVKAAIDDLWTAKQGLCYNTPYAVIVDGFVAMVAVCTQNTYNLSPDKQVNILRYMYYDGKGSYEAGWLPYTVSDNVIYAHAVTDADYSEVLGVITDEGIFSESLGGVTLIPTVQEIATTDNDYVYAYLEEVGEYCYAPLTPLYESYPAIPKAAIAGIPVTTIAPFAFDSFYDEAVSPLKEYSIPDFITTIGKSAFSHCGYLTEVYIPESVTTIGSCAFLGTALRSVSIPESVTFIADSAFSGCDALRSVVLPSSLTSIEESLFIGCSCLSSITYRGTVAQWNALSKGSNWSQKVLASYVQCADGRIEIDEVQTASLEGSGQEYYTMAPSVLSFRSTAPLDEFQGVQINGETIDPSNYELEEGSTIVKLSSDYLRTLSIGNHEISVVSNNQVAKGDFTVAAPELNEYGFYYNQPYTAAFPAFEDDEIIGYEYVALVINNTKSWFSSDHNLASLIGTDGTKTPLCYIIENTDDGLIVKLLDPSADDIEYLTARFQNGTFVLEDTFVFELGNSNFYSDGYNIYAFNGVSYSASHVAMYSNEYKPILSNVNNHSVTAISPYGYLGVTFADGVVEIPEGVTTIGSTAFAETNLSKLYLPSTLEYVESTAFWECYNIKSIHIPDLSTWFKINFNNESCARFASMPVDLYINEQLLEDVIIPADVTELTDSIFNNFSIKSLHIHRGIKKIGSAVIGTNLVDGPLHSITFEGSCAEWMTIEGSESFSHTYTRGHSVEYIQCSDGKVNLK